MAIRKERTQTLEFLIRQDSALRELLQPVSDQSARILIEEPKAGHGGVIDHGVITSHLKRQTIDLFAQIEMLVAIGHPMIAEQVKVGGSVMIARGEHELIDPLLVQAELVADRWRLITDVVKEAVEAWPIKESEINRFARDIPTQGFEV